jgi:hypothetical protein
MDWSIRGGPEAGPWEDKDAIGWRWEIERGEETRRLLVEFSGLVMDADPSNLPGEVLEARETQGRGAVESILGRDDPPGRISFSMGARDEKPYGGGQAR